MRLYSSDEKRVVNVGMGSIWYSLYSTAMIALTDDAKKSVPLAMDFLKSGNCAHDNLKETRKQLESIKNSFADLSPDKAIYDLHKPDVPPPWAGNIAPSVTSCANLYTTADGDDLFTEVFTLLDYAYQANVSIYAG